jgi:hypothetical protein
VSSLIVAGGSYREISRLPALNQWSGSGVRAAAILAGLGYEVTLRTALDPTSAAEAAEVARIGGFRLDPADRGYPMAYRYVSPLATPSATVPPRQTVRLDVEADQVVAFGMTEVAVTLNAAQAVIDPQNGPPEACGLTGESNPGRCLVLNHREARHLAGQTDLETAGRDLHQRYGTAAVIIKHAVQGALVVKDGGTTRIGIHPTDEVHPIGSGDAFTAGFAAAWFSGSDAVTAARQASRTAAAYCATGSPFTVADILPVVTAETVPSHGRLYLAGPFFSTAERWLIEHVRDALAALDMPVFSPLHDVGLGGDEVAGRDITGLETASGVLAILDGHDCGTLFEIGWARARGLPVVALALDPGSAAYTMLRGTDCSIVNDLATAVYHASWAALGDSGAATEIPT